MSEIKDPYSQAQVVSNEPVKRSLINRFRKIQGQLGGIQRMIHAGDKTVLEIFIQLSAVRSALDKASMLVLENHMLHCLMQAETPEDIHQQRESLVHFIRNYKYGTISSPFGHSEVDVLLDKAKVTTDLVIRTILDDLKESKCSSILQNTSQIREVLNSISIVLFEEEVQRTLFEDGEADRKAQLDQVLHMAKKFIV